jgi:hypothetical protein
MFKTCTRRPLGEDFARGWPDELHDEGGAPLVLFESPDGAEAHAAWKLLRRNGYRMTWCPGPQGGFSPECALSATGHCPLVDEADAVVSALDLRDPLCEEVVRALDAQAPETPVVVVSEKRSMAHWAEEAPDCEVIAGPLSSKVMIRALSVARAAATASARGVIAAN